MALISLGLNFADRHQLTGRVFDMQIICDSSLSVVGWLDLSKFVQLYVLIRNYFNLVIILIRIVLLTCLHRIWMLDDLLAAQEVVEHLAA